MIFEVAANVAIFMQSVDAQTPQMRAFTDAGELQKLWRIDCTCCNYHFGLGHNLL